VGDTDADVVVTTAFARVDMTFVASRR